MSEYRHGSHTAFFIHLHSVWITKYRHQLLRGASAERVRDIVPEECRRTKVDILKGPVAVDPMPILVSIPPQVAISRLIQQLKGKSSYRRLAEFADSDDVFRIEGKDSPSGESPSS